MGPLRCLTYVSRSAVSPAAIPLVLREIAPATEPSLDAEDITGVLVLSSGYFGCLVEGSADAIEVVLERLKADPCHQDLRIMSDRLVRHREIKRWSPPYVGAPVYLGKLIEQCYSDDVAPNSVARLIRVLRGFASRS
jgi:hypothetical protein